MTAFNDVSKINRVFGNPRGRKSKKTGKLQLSARFLKQIENIPGEYTELQNAIAAGDIDKVRDALADIIVFALGAQHILGVPGDKDMKAVTSSLYSRLCVDLVALEATVAKYTALGLKVYSGGKFPAAWVKASEDFVDADGNDYRKGKFLKSIDFKEPVFAQ